MVSWRFRPFALIVLIVLFVLVACDRPLPSSMDALPTGVPTIAVGGAEGDPEVGGGQGEVEAPTAVVDMAEPTAVAETSETSPRETAEPPDEGTPEPSATSLPVMSPTPSAEEEAAEMDEAEPPQPTEEDEEEAVAEAGADEGGDEADSETAAEAPEAPTLPATQEESASAEAAAPATPRTHTVAPGENLYRIGLQYGLSWVVIAQANGLTNANRITVGQVLTIPTEGTEGTPGTGGQPEQPTPSPQTETTHTVRPGENLFRIGLAYGIGWVQIAEANGLVSPSQIYVGQVLKIPVNRPGPTPEFTHEVRPGESLLRIALLYGIPWTTIAQANNLTSPYVIYPGQMLLIPGQ